METAEKELLYRRVSREIEALLEGETDTVARMAEVAAALHGAFGFWWTGFYRVCGDQLVLGPFQGPVACLRIGFGKGVCGSSWARGETIIVPDVEQFPGHIACSAASRSEIVVPVFDAGAKIAAVLDIDSASLATFDGTDARFLEGIAAMIYA